MSGSPGTSTTFVTEWIPFNVDSGVDPFLFPQTQARVGQSFVMDLTYVFGAFRPYVVAASLTTNTGLNAGGGLFVSLDPDPVFALSFPVPNPFLFTGFQGTLGHEFVGEVALAGASGPPAGARVVGEINAACRRCPTCAAGRPNHWV